jgi:hypothetical protein
VAADDDRLVYDGELGWIDPEDVLGSLGVTCRVGIEYLYYLGADMNEFRVPRKADWPLLRAVLADAERRAAEGG